MYYMIILQCFRCYEFLKVDMLFAAFLIALVIFIGTCLPPPTYP